MPYFHTSAYFSHAKGHTDELWGLAVHPVRHQFLTGASDKQLILWDAARHTPVWVKVGASCLASLVNCDVAVCAAMTQCRAHLDDTGLTPTRY